MESKTLPPEIEKELLAASHAESLGRRGRARVCARRAAGLAVRTYFQKIHHPDRTAGLYHLLELFLEFPEIPDEIHQLALHLTTRVSPDFELPDGIDLISDSRSFCEKVLRFNQ